MYYVFNITYERTALGPTRVVMIKRTRLLCTLESFFFFFWTAYDSIIQCLSYHCFPRPLVKQMCFCYIVCSPTFFMDQTMLLSFSLWERHPLAISMPTFVWTHGSWEEENKILGWAASIHNIFFFSLGLFMISYSCPWIQTWDHFKII